MSNQRSSAENGAQQPGGDAGSRPIQPLFLLADSQLLFFRDEGGLFLDRVRLALPPEGPGHHGLPCRGPLRAAYLGASNGDVRDYFDLFVAAMEGIDVRDCRHVPAEPSARDLAFLDEADLLLLAGGDVERGFAAFQQGGLVERIVARYAAGAVLMGTSAGAIQLGQRWLGLVPMLVAVHDEPEWAALAEAVSATGDARGLGIPAGGGAIVHADLAVEPVRKALMELTAADGVLRRALLLPGPGTGGKEGTGGGGGGADA